MFGFSRTVSVEKLRTGIINTQETMIVFKSTIKSHTDRITFFSESLEEHEKNWVDVMKNMRRVWKEMKKDFAATRRSNVAIGNRLKLVEKRLGVGAEEDIGGNKQLDYDGIYELIQQMEATINEQALRHNELEKRYELYVTASEASNKARQVTWDRQSTRLNRILRGQEEDEVINYLTRNQEVG